MPRTSSKPTTQPSTSRRSMGREEILLEASELFAERGVNATLQDVADRLGCTRQALYYYFESKGELVETLTWMGIDSLVDAVSPILASDLGPREKLLAVLRLHVRHTLSRKPIYDIYANRRHVVDDALLEKLNRRERQYFHAFTRVIAEWQNEAGTATQDPALATLFALGLCNSTLQWYRSDGGNTIDSVADQIAAFAMDGIIGYVERGAPPSTM